MKKNRSIKLVEQIKALKAYDLIVLTSGEPVSFIKANVSNNQPCLTIKTINDNQIKTLPLTEFLKKIENSKQLERIRTKWLSYQEHLKLLLQTYNK